MKRAKPIFVELQMQTELETLWERTQTPALHEQWDLRFSSITYLPQEKGKPQQFRYTTHIGFGMAVEGTGETRARKDLRSGERLSTLVFASDQPISLIREGRGYWKYEPNGDGVLFTTRYDYETRFGLAGRLLDRWLFRPLFGYATAWSFDLLRIWLEKSIAPAVTIERALLHYVSVAVLAILWGYEGLVPKLLFPESGELELLERTGWAAGGGHSLLMALGIVEIAAAVAVIKFHRHKWLYRGQQLALILLAGIAIGAQPGLLAAPFNPLTLTIPMLAAAFVAERTMTDLPQANRCRRAAPISGVERGVGV
ncbi:hypothetical protein FHS18_002359 [Paenibacillus phyllosphaerae]|uniref:DoxX-like family protein n=1 Tax=Paenibacillus phyllosphaerae TaxID=274593 RepID=A0A7W5FMP6_9BACL|nr:DoxX-like family protein [Paenibacillus phyllosphaerae]MBB3110292.1 hypothetical protein [Paenibacillus phyllosphaerae]